MKKGWKYKKFKDISHSISDGDWIEKKDQSNSGIRLIQTGNIGVGKFIPKDDSRKFITEDTFKRLKCSEIFEGDVLISRLPNPLGRSCILPKLDTRCITAVDCSIVRLKKEVILSEYFIYYTQSQGYFTKIDSESSGTTRARITRKKLEQTEIPIPPLSEQKEIVEYLDSSFAKIDKLKENAAKNLEEAKALFQSALKDALEPKEGWEEKTLGELGSLKNGMNFTKNESGTELHILGVGDFGNLFSISNTENLPIISLNEIPSDDYMLENEDIVFVRSNGNKNLVGRCLLVYPNNIKTSFSGFCIRFRKNSDKVDAKYLAYFLKAPNTRKKIAGNGANISNLNQKVLQSLAIPFPSLPEQQSIVSFLDSLSEKVNTLQQNYSRISNECDALKQAILRQVFE